MLEVIFSRISRFAALNPPNEATGRDQRRSQRLYTNLPIECRVLFHNQSGKFSSRATMKNISQGGVYLECVNQPRLIPGQVVHFTCKPLSCGPEQSSSIHLAAKAVVRRIVRPGEDAFSFGVAVEFISGPLICYQ